MIPTPAQARFAASTAAFPAFVGGFGSGKTAAGILRAIALKTQCRQQSVAYYLPTYGLVRDIALPRFAEALDGFKIPFTVVKAPDPAIELPNCGRFIFRTMDNPARIVGYEVAHSIVDELDTLPLLKAQDVWNKIISRNRQKCGMPNSVAVATTPEGFRFVYQRWRKDPAPGYVLYKARTYDNPHLPAGYIDNLRASYPTSLLAAYLDGEFVNLTAGSVYPEFNRTANHSSETIRPSEPLHVGMDFNVTKMAAVIHVLRDGQPHAVKEYLGLLDTPAMIALLKSRHPGHAMYVYPDASGGNRKSQDATAGDLALLRQAGWSICAHKINPAVKDRVLAVNAVLLHRHYRVNPDTCPGLVEALEQQAYDKNGEPDKTSGHDHVIDAAGYFIAYKFPIIRRTFKVQELSL